MTKARTREVAVIDSGYLGLALSACLAEFISEVVSGDIDVAKAARLDRGERPIYEPGLKPIVRRNLADVRASDIIFYRRRNPSPA